jgi:hypothetical protein
MITTPTTLVLGAGASVDCGYPSGTALRNQILELFNNRGTEDLYPLLCAGFSVNMVDRFCQNLIDSPFDSIDELLEHRPDIVDIGKTALAWALIRCEDDRKLNQGWYRYLFKKMNCGPHDFHKNEVSIVTFNYDRSFEEFLFRALKIGYNLPAVLAAQFIRSMNIIHLHGNLGKLPWQDPKGRRYAPLEGQDIRHISSSIKVVHEGAESDPDFQQARELLTASRRIVFLGFGYGEVNLGRLFKDVHVDQATKVFGCLYGCTIREQREINNRFRGLTGQQIVDMGATEDLTENPILNFLRASVDLA